MHLSLHRPLRPSDVRDHGLSRRRQGIVLICSLVAVSLASAVADADDSKSITEFETTPRLLISLLHEPYSAAVSPDGKRLATGHDDGSVIVWNLQDGQPVARLEGNTATVSALAFDATGSRLASASYDAPVRLWEVSSGELTRELRGHEGRATTVCFSSNGQHLISGGYDKTVRLWDLTQPGAEPSVLHHEATVRDVAFSPDGRQFATGDDTGTLILGNAADASVVKSVDAHDGAVRAIAFSPDGRRVMSGGDDGVIKIWSADDLDGSDEADLPATVARHAAAITCIQVSQDGRLLATADRQGEVQVWDRASGEATSFLTEHDDEIVGLAFLPETKAVVTVSRDRTANIWRSKLPPSPRLATIDNGDVKLWSLAIAPRENVLFTGGWHRYLSAWDLRTGEQLRQFEGFDSTIDALALTSDEDFIACCGWKSSTIAVFDTRTGEMSKEFVTETTVRCVKFSPDGQLLVAGGEDGNLHMWDWRTDADPTVKRASAQSVYDVVFSPDGQQLVTCGGDWRKKEPGDLTFWQRDGSSWSEVRRLTEHSQAVRAVSFNRDGTRLASAGEEGTVIIWHPDSQVPVARLRNAAGVREIAFSPRDDRLAVGARDDTINVWDIDRGEIVQRFQSEDDVFALSYSEDGTAVFSVSGENQIEVWLTEGAVSTAEQIRRWSPRDSEVIKSDGESLTPAP